MSNSWRQRVTQGMQQGVQGMQQGMQNGVTSAEQIAGQLVQEKLRNQLAVASGAGFGIGSLGHGINELQDDPNGNLLLNPYTQALMLGVSGAGAGYYGTEFMQNRRPGPVGLPNNIGDLGGGLRPMGSNVPNAGARPVYGVAPESDSRIRARETRQAGRRGRNAVYGAGAGMLVGLLRQMGNQPSQQEY